MSNVSNRHAVVTHVTGETKAFSGQRLVRVIAKKDSQGNYASPHLQATKSVSIPVLARADISPSVIEQFMPQILDMFAGIQDGIIADQVKEGVNDITDESISFDAIGKYVSSNAGSSRLTKETLQAWFIESYSEIAVEFICTAFKWDALDLSPEQETVLEQKINVLKDMFAGFSSGKYSPDDAKCKALIKFVAFAGDSADSRMKAFGEKAQAVMDKRVEELSSNALGF